MQLIGRVVHISHPDGGVWSGVILDHSNGIIVILWDGFSYDSIYGMGILKDLVIQCN